MRKFKPMLLPLLGAALLLTTAHLAAQNTVDVLGGGPQPPNTVGCAVNPQCIPALWSTTSNSGSDISAPITANFVFASAGGALATDFPSATRGQICLADTRDLAGTTLFAQVSTNCEAAGGVALLLIRDAAVTAPSAIPVFVVSTSDGDFLRSTVGFDSSTGVSNFPVRINVAVPTAQPNPANEHNCADPSVAAYVGAGTANYTPVQSLCLPDAAGMAGEPSMTVDSQGSVYVESIRGVPGGLDFWRWNAAADGPANANGTLPFKYEGQPDCGMFVSVFCNTSGFAPGGGDGDVVANAPDPANNNVPNVAVVSLSAAEVTASHSTNRGDTFSTPNPATTGVPFDDRMWLAALDDPNHVYIEYHDFGTTSQIFVQRSNDGGVTYLDAAGEVLDPTAELSAGPPSGNVAGQIKVDRSACASHGNIYQIYVAPDNPTDNAQNKSGFNNAAYVGVATNVSLTSPTLSFTNYKIFSCGAGSTCPTGQGLNNIFPALAVDSFGYLYATWSDGSNIYYSYSTSLGQRWSPAIIITQNTPQAGKSNVFPWIAADANGHVAVAWYGADQAGNSNSVPLTTNWNVYVAETANGHASSPAFTFNLATDHPNHQGQISTGGLLGNSDRSLSDFFQIGMDLGHHVNIAYDDNHAGATVTYFTRSKNVPDVATKGKCAGTGHQGQGKGHQNGKNSGSAAFAFSYDDDSSDTTSASASYTDPGAGINFVATQITGATFNEAAHTVTLVGSGTNNGLPVTFTIVAADSSLAAPGLFTITLSTAYMNTGAPADGSITVY